MHLRLLVLAQELVLELVLEAMVATLQWMTTSTQRKPTRPRRSLLPAQALALASRRADSSRQQPVILMDNSTFDRIGGSARTFVAHLWSHPLIKTG